MPEIAIEGYAEPMGKASRASLEGQVSSIDRSELADILRALESHRGRPGPIRAAPIPRSADESAPAAHPEVVPTGQSPREAASPKTSTSILLSDPPSMYNAEELQQLVEDLLRDIPDGHRPVAYALAVQAARSIMVLGTFYGTLLPQLTRGPDGEGATLDTLERFERVKTLELCDTAHLLLSLELLRRRHIEVEARVVPTRPRLLASGRRGAKSR